MPPPHSPLEASITREDAAQHTHPKTHTRMVKREPPADGAHAAFRDIRFVLEAPAGEGSTGALLRALSVGVLQG